MTIQLNPVAVRESRAMWRGARSFLLLLCYAGALSLVAFLAYNSEVRTASNWAQNNGTEMQVQSASVGHTLFMALSCVQLVAWVLIGPALSATSVSSERERGLLESLLMSNLKPRQIIAGKFTVSASFLGILIVATLPVLAICFLLGGVSPLEFGGAFAIQLATAFLALSLGIWCSTTLKLSTHALGAAFCALVGWLGATFFALFLGEDWFRHTALRDFFQLFSLTNPLFGLLFLVQPQNSGDFKPFGLAPSALWPLCVVVQVLAGAWFLHLAARHLSRPLSHEDAPERESRRRNRRQNRRAGRETAGEPVALLEGESDFSASTRADDGHFEMPILKHIVFGGPLMRHHLRAAWRWKKPRGRTLKLWKVGAVLFLLFNALGVLRMMAESREAEGWLGMLCLFVALAIPVYVAASAGLSIARDRELGIWNNLRLADLKPAEIARAKMLAPIVSGLSYATVLLPLGIVAWLFVSTGSMSYNYNRNYAWEAARFVLLGFPFWLLGTLQLSGWASICSLRAKRSSIALVASFAGGLIFLVGVPVVLELSYSGSSDYASRHGFQQFVGLFHPFYALITAADLVSNNSYKAQWSRPDLYVFALMTHSAMAYAFYRKVTQAIEAREK